MWGPVDFTWRSESDDPAPQGLLEVDDRTTADQALRRVRQGEFLLYVGDFHNAKQLLGAMGRRLTRPAPRSGEPSAAFRSERLARAQEHRTLSHLLVRLDPAYRLLLRRAPDVAEACREAWGPARLDTIVPLKALLGVLGAAEWRRKGLVVPGLKGRLTPHYGVYSPTRTDYVTLLDHLADVGGTTVLDVGTGTGVLSFLLLQRGAAKAVGTDCEPRAVACALDNAHRLKLTDRYHAEVGDLFPPEGRFDLIISNPPWLPETPRTRTDRAVFDDGGRFLQGLFQGARAHLAPNGRLVLLISDLAVLLGLRPANWLETLCAEHGMKVGSKFDTRPTHPRANDRSDPLHAARSRETTSLYVLQPT